MQAREPADTAARPRVWVGEQGRRADDLAYRTPPLAPSLRHNYVTAAAALPVLQALLPGAEPLRWSTPAPGGLPGGYPVRIDGGSIELYLPPGLTRAEAIAFNEQMTRADGVERVDHDGTVYFTAACREAVASLDLGLPRSRSPSVISRPAPPVSTSPSPDPGGRRARARAGESGRGRARAGESGRTDCLTRVTKRHRSLGRAAPLP